MSKSSAKSKALSNGRSSLTINGPAQGIVLHIHGCDGLGGDYFTGVWVQFFNSRGFYFFAPDSFADPRPAALCGRVADFNPLDEQKIQVTRIIQTLRSIEELKKRFPKLPIYLWGHSEGGIFIQFFSTDVAGIIVSGAKCGISGGGAATFPGTPILFLIGDRDEYSAGIVAKPTAKKVVNECARRLAGIPHKVTYVVNQNHYIYPWRKQIYEPIMDFIKGKQMNLVVHYAPVDFILSNEQKVDYASYLKAKNHRAFAVTTKGVSRWQDHWEVNDDAEFGALADCAAAIGTNLFTSGDSTACLIYDVNGKRKTRPLNTN